MHTYILEISAQMPSTYLPAKFAQTIQTEFTLSGSLLYSYSILYEAEMVAEWDEIWKRKIELLFNLKFFHFD